MDEEVVLKLCDALELSLSSDNNVRREAESVVFESMEMNGFCSAMLHIATNPKYNEGRKIDVTQAAAIQFKNMTEIHWRFKNETHAKGIVVEGFRFIIIQDEDKEYIRSNIMSMLLNVTNLSVRSQLTYAVECIVRIDFPEKWPNLIIEVKSFIDSTEESKIVTGLEALKSICKRYEFEYGTGRNPLEEIVENIFPRLEEIVSQIEENNTIEAFDTKWRIADLLFTVNQVNICSRYKNMEGLDKLVNFYKYALDCPISEDLIVKTEDTDIISSRRSRPEWKFKVIAIRFFFRIFQKYGNPDLCEEDEKELSEVISNQYNIPIIDNAISMISKSKEYFISPDLLGYALKILSQSTKNPKTAAYIGPNCLDLIKTYSIGLIMLTQKDIEDLYDNPIDFIRKMKDVTETFYSCKHSALEFINLTCFYQTDKNKEPDLLNEFFEYVIKNLEEIKSNPPNDFRIKDAYLTILENMSIIFKLYKNYNDKLEEALNHFALPGLLSENPLERFRSLRLYSEYSYLPLEKQIPEMNNQQHLLAIGEIIFKHLEDQEIVVKVSAASTLHRLIKKKLLKKELESQLDVILHAYLTMMNEIDSEDLVTALEEIVTIFKDSIEPYSIQLCTKLEESYWRLIDVEDDEGFGESGIGALTCLTTIKQIFQSLKSQPELLIKLEKLLFKMFINTTTPNGLEGLDDCLDLLAMVQFYARSISEESISLVPHFLRITAGTEAEVEGGYGLEYIAHMENYFKNLIQLAGDELFTRQCMGHSYIDLMLKSMNKIIEASNSGYSNSGGVTCVKIMISMIENLPGRLNDYIPEFIKLISSQLKIKGITKAYIQSLIQLLFCCFYYDPRMTFDLMEKLKATKALTEACFSKLNQFKETEAMRNVIIGIISILRLDPSEMPSNVSTQLKKIIGVEQSKNESLIGIMDRYVKARQNEQEEDFEGEGEDDEENFDDDYDDYYDDFDHKGKNKHHDDESGDDDLPDDDLMFSGSEMKLYKGPFDRLPAPLFFREIINDIPDSIKSLINSKKQQEIEDIFNRCDELVQN